MKAAIDSSPNRELKVSSQDTCEAHPTSKFKLNQLTLETLRKSALGKELHQANDANDLFDQLGI